MIKKIIIAGVCAVAFLLVITPTIPAQQCELVKETLEKDFQRHLDRAIIALRAIVEDDAQIEYQKGVVIESIKDMKQIWKLGGFDTVPLCFKFLLRTLLSLILSILGTIFGILFGKIFGPLLIVLVKVLTFPARLIAQILEFLFDRNKTLAG